MGQNGCGEMGRFGRGRGSVKCPVWQERIDDGITTGIEETGRGAHHAKSQMSVHAAEGDDVEFVGGEIALSGTEIAVNNRPVFYPVLAEISWLRGGRQRKSLICKATIQKVATTFLSSSRGLLGELELAPGVCAAAVAAATPNPISPRPADVRLPVGCSAASPVPFHRPRAHGRPA